MADNSSFGKNEERIIDIEHKDGLLEELNLPPKAIKFIRENSKNLLIAAACLVVLVFVWTWYDYHAQAIQNEASAALNAAVAEPDEARRLELLTAVVSNYSGTEAALWSRVEQAHLAFKAGKQEDALTAYNEIFADLDSDSPLVPLLNYNIALAYENNGNADQALSYYAKLSSAKGFETKGLLAQGRLFELRNDKSQALQVYRQAVEGGVVSAQDKTLLAEKINSLQTSGATVPDN